MDRTDGRAAAIRSGLRSAASVATMMLAFAGLGGCSTGGEPATAPVGAAAASSMPVPLTASAYFAAATSADLFGIRAADLALQRSSGSVRTLAAELKQKHQALSGQLAFAGRRLNMLASRQLTPEYQRMLAALQSSSDFDRTYLEQQRAVAKRTLRLHSSYLRQGSSPTLRPVAKFGVDVSSSELQLLARR